MQPDKSTVVVQGGMNPFFGKILAELELIKKGVSQNTKIGLANQKGISENKEALLENRVGVTITQQSVGFLGRDVVLDEGVRIHNAAVKFTKNGLLVFAKRSKHHHRLAYLPGDMSWGDYMALDKSKLRQYCRWYQIKVPSGSVVKVYRQKLEDFLCAELPEVDVSDDDVMTDDQ